MIELVDICYVRAGCADLEQMVDFGTRVLGLELRAREDNRAYLRASSAACNLCYIAGDPSYEAVAFAVRDEAALEAALGELTDAGCQARRGSDEECAERRVNAFVEFQDPNGNTIELVVNAHTTGVRYFPSRDAGITEFGHVGLHARDVEASARFWTTVLNARPSDWIGKAPLLRIDEVHHKIALFPSRSVGVQHINYQVASVDDIMRSWYFLQGEGIPIVFGPGRHPTSTAIFLYFEGPDGRTYEYSHGVKRITDEASYRPRQFESAPSSFCMWGARPNIKEFLE